MDTYRDNEVDSTNIIFELKKKGSMLKLNLEYISPENKSLIVGLAILMFDRIKQDEG
jgi:hypothetical protein